MKTPIPDDWQEADGYAIAWFCVPNSVQWRAVARGTIYELTRGRNWDERLGSVTDTQAIAREIYESLCMANCNDLMTQLTRIADALDGQAGALPDVINTQFQALTGKLDEHKQEVTTLNTSVDTRLLPLTNLVQLVGINTDLDNLTDLAGLGSLAGINTDLDNLVTILAQLSNIATDLDALTHLARLPDINDNLAHLLSIKNDLTAINGDLDNLSSLAELPRLQDIVTSIDTLGGKLASDQTLEDLVNEIELAARVDEFKDVLEMLTFMKDLAPNLGISLPNVWGLMQTMFQARATHNQLTMMAYQSTALRGIQNALAPFEEGQDPNDTEEGIVKKLYDEFDKLPWLTTVVAALVEPTPAGETAVATQMAATAATWFGKFKSLFGNFWLKYINQVEDPQPLGTVVGALMEISRKLVWDNWDGGVYTPGPTVQIGGTIATSLDIDVERNQQLADIKAALVNISTKKCGCSGACSCGASSVNVPSGSGTEGSLTPPIPFVTIEYGPTPTTPGTTQYYDRKCKAANRIHEDLVNYITHLDSINIVDQSTEFMFTSLSALLGITTNWPIIGTIAGVISGWLISLQDALAQTGVDLTGLVTALNADAQDLVCALYNSTSATEALTDYTDILSNAAVPAVDLAVVNVVLTPDVLNYLFFENDGYIDAELAGYTPPYPCDGCGDCPLAVVAVTDGHVQGDNFSININGQTVTIHSLNRSISQTTAWIAEVIFNTQATDYGSFCGSAKKVSAVNIVSGSLTKKDAYGIYGYFDDNRVSLGNGDVLDTNQCMRGIEIISSTEFTVEIVLGGDCVL